MTPQHIKITFAADAELYIDDPVALIHRIRNLGEDIYRAIRGKRIATLHNMDSATDDLVLTVPSAGKLSRVLRLIDDCLIENNFQNAQVDVSHAVDA